MISVYYNLTDNNLTNRQREYIDTYVRLIQWGRKNPTEFVEKIMQIPLLDYQKWLILNTWTKEFALWLCSRNAGKSFLVGIIIQLRAILFPKSKIDIVGAVGRISSDTFLTMENIIKNNVKTILRQNVVISDEIKRDKQGADGFVHDQKKGDKVVFQNGSEVISIIGSPKNTVGKRSNMLLFDESGIIKKELFDLVEPFATQSSDFKTGSDIDFEVYPSELPNLRLYVGSATDTNSTFYTKYKNYSTRMFIGDEKYFVADLNCEMPLHPTMNGKPYPALLAQSTIDAKMRENEISANREYYNIFDRFDSEDSVLNRADIMKYTQQYVPNQWGGRKHRYVISYDPSSRIDCAPVLVTEIIKEDDGTIKGKFIHMENLFIRYQDGQIAPMKIEDQVQRLRELMYYYNGSGKVADYENVLVFIDDGIGGNSSAVAQELCKDWIDSEGKSHPGIFDEDNEHGRRWASSYPRCKPGVLKMINPTKWRTTMYEAVRTMAPSGGFIFPPEVPKDETLIIYNPTYDKEMPRKLGKKERESLIQMHLMTEEMCLMVRSKNNISGKVSYGYPPEVARKLHDDRAYVFALAALAIKMERDEKDFGNDKPVDFSVMVNGGSLRKTISETSMMAESAVTPITAGWGKIASSGSAGNKHKASSPFSGTSPFKK